MRFLYLPALLILACNPKPADTDGDASSSAGTSTGATEGAEATSATNTAPTTGGTTTAPTTDDVPTPTATATFPTSAEDTATDSVPGTAGSSATDTGDETGGNPGLPGACAEVCMRWDMCEPGSAGPVDACVADCTAGVDIPSPCAMASAALASCIADLPCEEALKFLEGPNDRPTSCLEELGAVDAVCEGPPGCGGEITGGGGFCEFEQECDGLKQNYACDLESNTCTCTENDVPGKQCPADGFCDLERDDQLVAVEACCGWQWM